MHPALIVFLCLLGVFLALVTVSIIRALTNKKTKQIVDNFSEERPNQQKYAQTLSEMLKHPTLGIVAGGSEEVFSLYYKKLQELFPLFFKSTQKIDIDDAYLFVLKGKTNGQPNLVMAHSDVVGVNQADWDYAPFDGVIADGKVWGRGAMDDKGMLCAILSSLEMLLEEGFVPQCDLYILSTKDEESSAKGAVNCANYFKAQGITLESVLDEGGSVTCKVMPSIANDIAVVGMCEKGYLDMRFTARSKGGHASTPEKNNPVARLAAFVNYCETHQIFKNQFSPTFTQALKTVVPYMSFPYRVLLGNLWLYKPLLKVVLPKISKSTAAMMHTNIVFTMCSGSHAPNVLPERAWVIGNIRNLNEQPQGEVVETLTKLAAKFDLEAEVVFNKVESTITAYDSPQFSLIEKLVSKHYPGTITTPFVMMGGTDSTRFCTICSQILRFLPIRLSSQQLNAMHAANENVGIVELAKAVELIKDFIATK